jgi:Holliday junction resolvase RusA-like endonuclease
VDHDFVVATKPEGKARARTVRGRNGHVHSFTPDATVLKQLEVKAAYQRAFPRDDPHAGPVRMTLEAIFIPPESWPKWKRESALRGEWRHVSKPDADNILKLVKDALKGTAYIDDSQVFDCHPIKLYSTVQELRVHLELLDQPKRGNHDSVHEVRGKPI